MICTPHPILFGYKIEKNKMGGACSAYGGDERCVQGFGGEISGKMITWKTTRKWEGNIKMDLQEVGCRLMD